jgi:hypothetical protein
LRLRIISLPKLRRARRQLIPSAKSFSSTHTFLAAALQSQDGFITREEILEMDEVPERDEIDEFFNTYDKDADGRVTFDEILTADSEVRGRVNSL